MDFNSGANSRWETTALLISSRSRERSVLVVKAVPWPLPGVLSIVISRPGGKTANRNRKLSFVATRFSAARVNAAIVAGIVAIVNGRQEAQARQVSFWVAQ